MGGQHKLSVLLVALGGGAGAVSRYLIGSYVDLVSKSQRIPVAMLSVNIVGAGGLGLLLGSYYETISPNLYSCNYYLCFGVGFFGAFTTFSTFSMEAVVLLQKRRYQSFMIYIVLSLIGCVFAFSMGFLSIAQQ
jgi:fluoride exporter